MFLPNTTKDYVKDNYGVRVDNRNLIDDWVNKMKSQNKSHKLIWNSTEFRNTNMRDYDHILGEFYMLVGEC